jgi:hypothetical protein
MKKISHYIFLDLNLTKMTDDDNNRHYINVESINNLKFNFTLDLTNWVFEEGAFEKLLDMVNTCHINSLIIGNFKNIYNSSMTIMVDKLLLRVNKLDNLSFTCDITSLHRLHVDIDRKLYLRNISAKKIAKHVHCSSVLFDEIHLKYLMDLAIESIDITILPYFTMYNAVYEILQVPSKLSKETVVKPYIKFDIKFSEKSTYIDRIRNLLRQYNYFHLVKILINHPRVHHGANPLLPFPICGGHMAIFRLICDYAICS